MRVFSMVTLAACLSASAAAADFSISFEWGDIPRCTTGRPNVVGNPRFILSGVPAGTDTIEFRLKDLDVPGYNHGGGRLRVGQDGAIPSGTFTYKSPCPPNGVHTYEWRATARRGNQVLGQAAARRRYPE